MGHKRTEHRNAIVKMVNDVEIIMQKELADKLNKTSVSGTIDILVKEGRLKREKIKVRSSSGGLFDQYVLYSNHIKYEQVLDFEKEQINKPFESPLKENHCYAKLEIPKPRIKGGKVGRPRKILAEEIIEVEVIQDENEMIVVDNSIIPIYDNRGERIVNARELHEFLGVKSKFADWIKNKIEKYQFIETEDFVTVSKNLESGGKTIEYLLKMDTAKEIAMVENNDRGRYIRKYFIDIEKKFKEQNSLQPISNIQMLKQIVLVIEDLEKRTFNMEQKFKLLAQ